jgi:hypothetical protein
MPRIEGSGRKRKVISPELELMIAREYEGGRTMESIYMNYGINKVRQKEIYAKHKIPLRGNYKFVNYAKIENDIKDVVVNDGEHQPIDCDKEGKKCKYHTISNVEWKCDYISMEHHSRGCDPHHCTKWQPTERRIKQKKGEVV